MKKILNPVRSFYLPSGRVIVSKTQDDYKIESTEMRDVSLGGKENSEVRTTNDPHIVWKHLVPIDEKWLLTISTQKGCQHSCKFCDVAHLPFKGNLSAEEMESQIKMLVETTPEATNLKKAKIGFARMGEPAHNLDNVLTTMKWMKNRYQNIHWLPCFNSILPKKCSNGMTGNEVLKKVLAFKNDVFDGFLHLQISSNSTDENKRKELFGGANVLPLKDVIRIVNESDIKNRTVTLNFISMQGIELDVNKLIEWGINKEKFAVKVIPLNATNNAGDNDLETVYNYNNFDQLMEFKEKLSELGIPIVVDAIAKCEEAGLCCGQIVQNYMSDEKY